MTIHCLNNDIKLKLPKADHISCALHNYYNPFAYNRQSLAELKINGYVRICIHSQQFTTYMSQKHSYTTADYLPWNTMLNLTHRLFKDGRYRMSLLVACGSFFGLRISDLLSLSWEQILSESFTINEKKTGKHREIKVNVGVREHIKECYKVLNITDPHEKCFLNRYGDAISVQRINVVLKEIKVKYRLKDIQHFSTHSFRKTFGRQVVEMAGKNSEMALIKLAELFNHSSTSITRRYLGIRQQELNEVYDTLAF